ncbi:MAG: dynamin [Spirulina sp. SIO3F2]|nr:dynamin [Spirulina sp. SIO3F2]
MQAFVEPIRTLLALLELPVDQPLYQEAIALCEAALDPTYRIAVFGPFNYGKSTLLNALLGQKALPIGLIPTTGAAIAVRYGEQLQSQVTLTNEEQYTAAGTQLLQDYALLDGQRQMRSDVAAVAVTCPHPLLKLGIEFLDLPGTNDQTAQDALVRERLLTADLILQVLDGRKLMTLAEREHLQDWLSDRGIRTVVFVVNFMNLLEPEAQQTLQKRLRLVAESFRADLPPGVSNLFRVDALPALRARLKGDGAATQTTGLLALEAAIQQLFSDRLTSTKSSQARFHALCPRLQTAAQHQQTALEIQLQDLNHQYQARLDILTRAQTLIRNGFAQDVRRFETWLAPENLRSQYQETLTDVLMQAQFEQWFTSEFHPTVERYRGNLRHWLSKASDFFLQPDPGDCAIAFPPSPIPPLPPSQNVLDDYIKTENFQRLLDSPWGYRLRQKIPARLNLSNPHVTPLQICHSLAKDYLIQFSQAAQTALLHYVQLAQPAFQFTTPPPPPQQDAIVGQLSLLKQQIERLATIIEAGG